MSGYLPGLIEDGEEIDVTHFPRPKIHDERVDDFRGPIARLRGKIRHRHYVVRRTWTLDGSSWATDRQALEFCECGAFRRLWGPGSWSTP